MADTSKTTGTLPEKVPFSREYGKAIFGSVGLILLAALAFILTEMATEVLRSWDFPKVVIYLLSGSVLALFIVVIGALLMSMLEWPVTRIINHSANELKRVTPELVTATKDIVERQKQLRNIGQIVLLEDFEKLQRRFMEVTELVGKSHNLELRIVGTMLGTYGKSSMDLADNLIALSNESNPPTLPFKEAYIGVPGHLISDRNNKAEEGGWALYPFSARVTAGKILVTISKQAQEIRLPTGGLKIHINFVPRKDIFPAIQMWGTKCAMVLSSTGAEDCVDYGDGESKAISGAMPVALVLKEESTLYGEESPIRIRKTLDRIQSHLESDYGLTNAAKDNLETWTLQEQGQSIKVENYRELQQTKHFLSLANDSGVDLSLMAEKLTKGPGGEDGKMSVENLSNFVDTLGAATLEIARWDATDSTAAQK